MLDSTSLAIILFVTGSAFLLSLPGGLALLRSSSLYRSEHDLNQRLRELELEINVLRRELNLVREERDRINLELASAKSRIVELEQITSLYQATLTPKPKSSPTTSPKSSPTTSPTTSPTASNLLATHNSLTQQLSLLDRQILGQGGETHAPAELVIHRDDLKEQLRYIEMQLDNP